MPGADRQTSAFRSGPLPRGTRMSAYGVFTRKTASTAPLEPRSVALGDKQLTLYHVTLASAPPLLVALLHKDFNEELERGNTYPQEEPMDANEFAAYFFAGDVFVALFGPSATDIVTGQCGRTWEDCVAGCFYVKANYPGRSSHICNGGFVVRSSQRGQGVGTILAQCFVDVAPKLGFKASVFNLVYANNAASVRLWDRHGFERVGRIPRAGRLRNADGSEGYFDAWVVYKDFEAATTA